jgi:exodeoxyribonuclease VII small subunit
MADPADDEITYAAATAELERILATLERSDLDVDELSTNVARAADLIRACRARIGNARLEVERIVAQLDPD